MITIVIDNNTLTNKTEYVDEVTPYIIRGWACDEHTVDPVEVCLFINNEFVEKNNVALSKRISS